MDADLDTLAIALYVGIDDLLMSHPERRPWRPKVGIAPKLSDAELLTVAVLQALLGFTSAARWLRFAFKHLQDLFPYLPLQPGYNKRLRKSTATPAWLIGALARQTAVWGDDVWVADSTPIECARSWETVKRSDLAGFAEYGYCASHSRYFWGLRLHLLATVHGLPVGFALTGAKADERHTLLAILTTDPDLAGWVNQTLIADKNYYGREFEATLPELGISLLRPARNREPASPGARFFKPAAPDHRVDQRHPQGPARPRNPRRAHPRRSPRPALAAPTRPHRRHLAQRHHRRPHQKVSDRLRPLTPLGITHLRDAHGSVHR